MTNLGQVQADEILFITPITRDARECRDRANSRFIESGMTARLAG
jgi:hypothetical protein